MTELDLARIQQAHHRRILGVQNAAGDLMGEAWDTFAGLDDIAAARFEAAASVIRTATTSQISTLAVGYMDANDRLGGFPRSGLAPVIPSIRNGLPPEEIYHRSIVQARVQISKGATYDEAMRSGRSRAVATARTDTSLANREELSRGGELRPWVVGYRRVLTGQSCAFCATASTQRYKSADLLPLHPSCDCDVAEIFGTEDPGHIINRELLDALKKAGRDDGRPRYWDGPYVVDEKGVVRFRKVENVLGPDGQPMRLPNGEIRRRVVPGDRVSVEVVDHGELGPTLTDARHAVAEVDVPTPSSSAPVAEPAAPPRAPRRPALTADDPDVIAVAERFGVTPDDVLSARTRVADVRKVAREEAARVQAEALRELDRLDAFRLKNPPRIGSKTDLGSAARRGEYDWLEQISDKEKGRLSRQWYGGTSTPDQFAQQMGAALNRDLSVDEAMDLWMDLNRRAEAAGAVRRGKLPSLDAYSGQIDIDDILNELVADGYDPKLLFGDDLTAAGHIAEVESIKLQQDAIGYLGDAYNAIEGPRPYRMSFSSWSDEVADLEHATRNGYATPAQRRRLRELVPESLDGDDVSYEELYDRIVATARKAGEEIPDLAKIQSERDFAFARFLDETEAIVRPSVPEVPAGIRPGPGSSDIRELVKLEGKAEEIFGDTVERLANLHGGPVDSMDPVRVIRGGKTQNSGGYFAPEGKRPPKPRRLKGKSSDQYRAEYRAWLDDKSWRTPEIRINNRGTGDDLFAFLHEMGHRFDFMPRSGELPRGGWRSLKAGPEMDDLMAAIRDSDTYKDAYKNYRSIDYVNYYRSPEESWARAYSQWAAKQLGGPELDAFQGLVANDPHFQWAEAEFDRLAPLVEKVLRAQGLIA